MCCPSSFEDSEVLLRHDMSMCIYPITTLEQREKRRRKGKDLVFSGRESGAFSGASLLTLSSTAGSTPFPRSSASTTCHIPLSSSLPILLPFFSSICLCDFLLARHPLLFSDHFPWILWTPKKHLLRFNLDEILNTAVCKQGLVNKPTHTNLSSKYSDLLDPTFKELIHVACRRITLLSDGHRESIR